LLRCYGHVDQLLLGNGGLGNPADIVEIRADLVLSSFEQKYPEQAGPRSSERVDWWLEEGGDECITLFTRHFECPDLAPQCLRRELLPKCIARRDDIFCAPFDNVSTKMGKGEAQVEVSKT
jgi:hypothetical protein